MSWPLVRLHCQRIVQCPSRPNTVMNNVVADRAVAFNALRQRHGLSFVLNTHCRALVSRLRDRRCPATVIGRIVLRHVNSVDAMSRRALAHVRNKSVELFPCIAYGNAASAVVRETSVVLVEASSHHELPRNIGSAMSPCACMSMRDTNSSPRVVRQTTTTSRIARNHVGCKRSHRASAFASTCQSLSRLGKHMQASKYSSWRDNVQAGHSAPPMWAVFKSGEVLPTLLQAPLHYATPLGVA